MRFSRIVSDELVELAGQARASVVQVASGRRGAGAGMIWHEDGLILTNYHVIARARGLQVLLADDRLLDAKLVAEEAALDLALVKVNATDLPAVKIGDSRRLRVGDLVFAVGHPWGERDVVTAGIVCGLGELRVRGTDRTSPYIRSNVMLAPGNSGGPLLDASGAAVGVNSMIFGGDLALSIPSRVVEEWAATWTRLRVKLDLEVQPVPLLPAGQLHAIEVEADTLERGV